MNSNQAIESSTFFLQANDNLGAMEIGTFIGMGLFGVAMAQVHHYFNKSRGDRLFLKSFVAFLTFLEVCHTFTSVQGNYRATITEWAVAKPNSYGYSFTVMLESFITFMVQGFFSYRIYTLSHRLSIAVVCSVLTLGRCVGVFVVSIYSLMDVPKTPNGLYVHTYGALITTAMAAGAAVDLLIAMLLIYYLRKMLNPFATKRMIDVINRLVLWSLQTGSITSLMSVAIIVCFRTMSNMIWGALYIILAKLYSVSLLAQLNSRETYRSLLVVPPPAYSEKVTTLRFERCLSERYIGGETNAGGDDTNRV